MNITTVQYCKEIDGDGNLFGENVCIKATINDDTVFVPLDPANTQYAEILKQVADGDLTIADADEE
jgi:hypothetical protein